MGLGATLPNHIPACRSEFLLDYCVSGVQGEDSSRGSENKKCFKLYVLYYLIENILKLMNRTTGAKGNNCFASHETFVKIPA